MTPRRDLLNEMVQRQYESRWHTPPTQNRLVLGTVLDTLLVVMGCLVLAYLAVAVYVRVT